MQSSKIKFGQNHREPGFATRAIHHAYEPADHLDAVEPPIFMTSTFAFGSAEEGGKRFAGESDGYIYSRISNPTVAILEERLANLEGGEAAVAVASGMSAITAAVLTLLKPGDEILAGLTLYGCTFALLKNRMANFGVVTRHVDMSCLARVQDAITERTRLVFFETPANPNLRLVDIEAVSCLARSRGILVMVDNTYATPVLTRPLELGASIVVHSLTKYISGHGDVLAGALIANREIVDAVRTVGIKEMTGACLSPFNAFLVLRGLKTLELRMERHCHTAHLLAERLAEHPLIETVHYPGLADFPQAALAQRQMGTGGGMVAFELRGGRQAALGFIDGLRLARRAVSLGDTQTLVQHPASMTHATYGPRDLAEHDIKEELVRISAGLETPEDIWDDVEAALEPLSGRGRRWA